MMGCRLPRARLLDRYRLAKVLVMVLILILVLGHHHRSALAPRVHRISRISGAHDIVDAISSGQRLTATDVSQPQYARALCREHGLDVFKRMPIPRPGTGSSKRKVFDLLTVDTELDWLEIRLNSSYDFVDYFVIVEGRKTTTGLDKPLMVRDNWDRLAPYHAKIIYHEVAYAADLELQRRGVVENHQRNAAFSQVFPGLVGGQAPTQGDVLIVANVDELVRPEALLVLRACETPRRLTLHSKLYYYSFQFLHRGMDWPHPQATTFQGLDETLLPDDLRHGHGPRHWGYFARLARWPDKGDLWNAGWHCASCFSTLDDVVRLTDGYQVPLPAPNHQERDRIVDWVRRGEDLRDQPAQAFIRIEPNEDVPPALTTNTERWRYLLHRNGTSVGLEHYP